jgi:hypothetical protein
MGSVAYRPTFIACERMVTILLRTDRGGFSRESGLLINACQLVMVGGEASKQYSCGKVRLLRCTRNDRSPKIYPCEPVHKGVGYILACLLCCRISSYRANPNKRRNYEVFLGSSARFFPVSILRASSSNQHSSVVGRPQSVVPAGTGQFASSVRVSLTCLATHHSMGEHSYRYPPESPHLFPCPVGEDG